MQIAQLADEMRNELVASSEIETLMKDRKNKVGEPSRKHAEQLLHNDDVDGGHLIVWGCGEFGQHGHGHTQDILCADALLTPVWYGESRFVDSVACGSSHTLIITDDNRVYSWGNSNSGQLGNGTSETCLVPHLVKLGVAGMAQFKGITCGTRHSFVWTKDGDCYSFGNNYSAQLGYDFRKPDFKENQMSPVYVDTLLNRSVIQVACGARHTVFLFWDRKVASVGSNNKGQLGIGSSVDVVCPSNVTDLQNIVCVGCGNSHTLAADENGNLYAWGYSKACGTKEDQLSPKCVMHSEVNTVNVTSLAGGDSHSVALINKVIFSWGSNFEGQLGHGQSVKFISQPSKIPFERLQGCVSTLSVGENTCAAVSDDGFLFMWGKNSSCVIRPDEGPRFFQYEPWLVNMGNWKVHKVACGSWHVACIVTPRTNSQKNPCSQPRQLTCCPTTEQTSDEISRASSYIDLNSDATEDNEENVNGMTIITGEICVEKQPDIASGCSDSSVTQLSSSSSSLDDRQTIVDIAYDIKVPHKGSDETESNLREEKDLKLRFCEEDYNCEFDDASSADSARTLVLTKNSHAVDSVNDQIFVENPSLMRDKLDSEALNQKTELSHSPLNISVLQEYSTLGSICSGPSDVQNSEYNAKTTAACRSETKNLRDQTFIEKVLDAKSMDSETAKKVIFAGEQNEDSILNEKIPISSVSFSCRYFNHEDNSTPYKTNRIADSVWNQSQTIPISSVSHPVKQEDLHHAGGGMSNITLGFQSDKQEIAPVSSVTPLEKTIHRFTNKPEGNHASGNLKRSKKPPRSFRRVSSNAEQLDYILPNQTVSMCETNTLENWAESRSSIKRTQSASDLLKGRLSVKSPNSYQDNQSPIHVPRPPPVTRKLSTGAGRTKQLAPTGHKLLFSSGASWRKRK